MEKRKKDGCETSRNRQKKETGKRNRIVLLAGAGIVAAALLTGGLMHGCREKIPTIEDALRFYLGFLSAEKSEDYLLQSLSSMLGGTVKDSENRLARMDFKMAVELAKLCHVIAYSHEVDEGDLQKLHAKCVEEVSRINGTVLFEDAYRYQRGRE